MVDFVFNLKNIKKIEAPETGYRLYKYSTKPFLCIKITNKGTKTYIVRFKDGKKKAIDKFDNIPLNKAIEKAEDMRIAYAKGLPLDGSTPTKSIKQVNAPTFIQMADKYLTWSKQHKKDSTIETDRSNLKNHIIPVLGNMKVNKITTRDIATLIDSIKGKSQKYTYIKSIKDIPLKNLTQNDFINILSDLNYNDEIKLNIEEYGQDNIYKALLFHTQDKDVLDRYFKKFTQTYTQVKECGQGTANRIKATLSHMFNTAMMWNEPEWECITKNPCQGIKSSQPKAKTRYLDKEELNRLYNVLEADEYKNSQVSYVIRFLLATGARKSEALTAKWEHIDFNRNIWRKPDTGSKTKLAPPVPLAPPAIKLLTEMLKKDDSGYIFKSPTDSNKHLGDFKKSFKTIMNKSSIENCSPHDLRRTFGSQLLLEGIDVFTVSKLLGHNSVSTTERHYAFLNLETLHSAVNVLDRIMR